jgi:hypothetical protein
MHQLVIVLRVHRFVVVRAVMIVEVEQEVTVMIVVHVAKLVQNEFVQNSNRRLSVFVA